MRRNRKELWWTAVALAGVIGGAAVAAQADDDMLAGPKVEQKQGPRGERPQARAAGEGERHRPQGPRGERNPGEALRGHIHRLLEGVNPTDQQKEQIRQIVEDAAQKWKAFHEEHQAEFNQLRKDFQAAREARDREKMKELSEKRRELMGQMPDRGEAIEAVKKILTPEQLARFEENLAAQRERMQQRMQRGGEGEARPRGPQLSDEQREKLRNMTPEERRQFMQDNRPKRGEGDRPAGQRTPRPGKPADQLNL